MLARNTELALCELLNGMVAKGERDVGKVRGGTSEFSEIIAGLSEERSINM